MVWKEWIISRDFNEVIEDAKKSGGRRKPRITMEEFHKVIDELALVEIKSDKG